MLDNDDAYNGPGYVNATREDDDANDDAFYENFNYLNPAGIEVGPEAYEYPPFQVGGADDYVMEWDGDAAAREATAGLETTLLPGTRGKRRADPGKSFHCFYCNEASDKEPFYIPDVTPAGENTPGKVIDRAFCIAECAMGWIIHEVSVGNNLDLKVKISFSKTRLYHFD